MRELPAQPQQVRNWNSTERPFSSQSTIVDLIDAAASAYAEKAAVIGNDGRLLSHGQLAAYSTKLAECLAQLNIGGKMPIGVLFDHTPEAVAGLHGIIRSGAFFVPIDRRWPIQRILYIVRKLGITVILVTSNYTEIALRISDAMEDLRVVQLNPGTDCTVMRGGAGGPAPIGPRRPTPGDLAYAIFTSGSTGDPKAVAVRHTSVVNLIEWFNRRHMVAPGDRVLQVASFCFDLSVYDVFGAIAAGASVYVIPDDLLEEPADIAAIIGDCGATIWNSAPAMFTATTEFLEQPGHVISCDAMRHIFLSGDWIPLSSPGKASRYFPNATLISLGGATEACVWSNDFVVGTLDPAWRSIPYGHPMQNAKYYVLRDDLAPCALDEPGELYISGACLSAGYLGDSKLTSERFLPDPWDPGGRSLMYRTGDRARWTSHGWVEFLGRIDSQVKVRGYRIELGEIEHAAQGVPGVLEAIAMTVGNPWAPVLVLAVRANAEVTAPKVTEFLAGWLPDYMRPSRIFVLPNFPIGSTGKVDRKKLRNLVS